MKKIIYIVCCILLALSGYLIINTYVCIDNNKMVTEKQDIDCQVIHKGLKGAVDFTRDESGNYYIAYGRNIQYIDEKGKSFDILNDAPADITSLDYYEGELYIALGCEVMKFNPRTLEKDIIIDNLPNFGDYKRSIVRVQDNCLYVTVGSATNSGVCGSDNKWIESSPFSFDITPKDITLKGYNFGEEKTGAFVPYKTKNAKGQVITGHFPGNGSLIIYYLNDKFSKTYAWGIRNITGIDFTSTGKVIAGIGGMEDRGLRPVKGDTDYIYELKKDVWYGWPDYSGGDPVTSPKFKGRSGSIPFILDNHTSTNPPAPIYQHNSVNTIGSIAVDTKGCLGDIDNIYFYDSLKKEILTVGKAVIPVDIINVADDKAEITSMKFEENNLMLLDGENGSLYKVFRNIAADTSAVNKKVMIYLLSVIVLGIVITINIKR